MTRPLFDPAQMKQARQRSAPKADAPGAAGGSAAGSGAGAGAGESAAAAPQPDRLSVSQLTAIIGGVLRDHVPGPVWVAGEVSGLRERTHWYFDLKDAHAVISCVMFASAARAARFRPESGRQVLARGRVEFFGRQGKTQFYVDRIEPVGAGALDEALRRLMEELRGLGYFDPARKRPLPRFARRIAVVTSASGAALQDVIDTARRRAPWVEIALVDVPVQGEGSAGKIARALDAISSARARLGIDAVILTRGGGSMEDLWAFNERAVADAILRCQVPIVAAIGHETDPTIAELVADERCATPTQAAMRLTPDREALLEQAAVLGGRLSASAVRMIRVERERLRGAARHRLFGDPMSAVRAGRASWEHAAACLKHAARTRVARAAQRVERAQGRLAAQRPEAVQARRQARLESAERALARAMAGRLRAAAEAVDPAPLIDAVRVRVQREGARVEGQARALDLVSPLAVLRRGYSVTLREDGRLVRHPDDAGPGERIETRLADGSFRSRVESEGRSLEPPRPKPRRSRGGSKGGGAAGPGPDTGQMDLFRTGG